MSGVISAQVTDELLERIDAMREGDPPDYDESRSATVRRLVRRGLDDAEADSGDDTDTLPDRFITALAALAVTAYPTLATYYGRPDTAAVWLAIVFCYVLFQPRIDQAIDRLPNPLNRL